MPPKLPPPRGWKRRVRSSVLQILALSHYTFTVLVSLEDYGFCDKGEGGPFIVDTGIGPEGQLPVNTGGGQLSSFYMWGMTPVSEAVIQLRDEGGDRQVPNAQVALVSGNGGILSTHSTLILANEAH